MMLPQYEQHFAAAGIAILAFDYRNTGQSDGQPRQRISLRAPASRCGGGAGLPDDAARHRRGPCRVMGDKPGRDECAASRRHPRRRRGRGRPVPDGARACGGPHVGRRCRRFGSRRTSPRTRCGTYCAVGGGMWRSSGRPAARPWSRSRAPQKAGIRPFRREATSRTGSRPPTRSAWCGLRRFDTRPDHRAATGVRLRPREPHRPQIR